MVNETLVDSIRFFGLRSESPDFSRLSGFLGPRFIGESSPENLERSTGASKLHFIRAGLVTVTAKMRLMFRKVGRPVQEHLSTVSGRHWNRFTVMVVKGIPTKY